MTGVSQSQGFLESKDIVIVEVIVVFLVQLTSSLHLLVHIVESPFGFDPGLFSNILLDHFSKSEIEEDIFLVMRTVG